MKKLAIILVLLVSITLQVAAQTTAVRQKEYNLATTGLGIQGYDPVAYFVSTKAIEGKKDIATVYNGVTYRFATTQNRDTFKANPAKYEPQYGGWCAYAMGAKSEKVEIDPGTFKITDGKLFLFYNKYFNNTLKKWEKDESNLHASADKNWTKFVH